MKTVLITGAGAPGIRGTIYCLKEMGAIRCVGVDINPDAVGKYFVDAFYPIPKPDSSNYFSTLSEIIKKENVDLVIPQTTREIEILSKTDAVNVPIMVSNEEAIERANNKYLLMKVFEELSLPVPKYRLISSKEELIEACKSLGYPNQSIAIKPPISNGMRGFRVITDEIWDQKRFLNEKPSGIEISLKNLIDILENGAAFPKLLVTEFLPGPEYSVDLFVGKDHQVAIPRLRKSIRSGISFDNILEYREDIMSMSLQVAKYLGLRYAVGFQYKISKEGIPMILECNPRIQGTMCASSFSGINIIALSVQEALGLEQGQIPENLEPASFHRYWGGFGCKNGKVYEI